MKKIFIDETKLQEVMDIIDNAASLMEEKDCKNDEEARNKLEKLQEKLENLTENKEIDITNFREYWGCISLEEAAKSVLISPPQKENITDGEIKEIIFSIFSDDNIGLVGESEMDYWIRYLELNTGLPNLSDYIFWPGLAGLDENASLEEIANKIIADRK